MVFSANGFAQHISAMPDADLGMITHYVEREQASIEKKLDVNDLSDVNGSPYWNDNYKKGSIYVKRKDDSATGYLRYRVFDDVFEYKDTTDLPVNEVFTLSRDRDVEMTLEGETFVWLMNLPAAGEGQPMKEGYAMILEKGENENDVTLYKRFKMSYTPAQKKKNSFELPKKAQLKTDSYYILGVDYDLLMINPSRKKVTDAFPDHKAELQKYIKDNALKFKKKNQEEDLVELVKYYNGLK